MGGKQQLRLAVPWCQKCQGPVDRFTWEHAPKLGAWTATVSCHGGSASLVVPASAIRTTRSPSALLAFVTVELERALGGHGPECAVPLEGQA